MDLKKYKLLKKQRQEEDTKVARRFHCFRCFRPEKQCICESIEEFSTNMKVIILMHPMEAKKEKIGTGRLTSACIKESEVIIGIDFTESSSVNNLINDPQYFPMVLYPGEKAINVSEGEFKPEILKGKIPLIFVIDGTWPCAKKMMKLSKNLHELPRICFTPSKKSIFHIKHQPNEMCLSTIEAVHMLLSEWERQGMDTYNGTHDILLKVFQEVIDYQVKCANDPNLKSYRGKRGYSTPEERRKSKKWDERSLFFN